MTRNSKPSSPPPSSGILSYQEDDIDLLDLGLNIWHQKWVVIGFTAAALALGALTLIFIDSVYESTARLRPPLASQLAVINETGQLELTPSEAFKRVVFEARSVDTQREVFANFTNRLLADAPESKEAPEQYFRRRFISAVTLVVEGLDANDVLAETALSITFQHTDNQLAADIANTLANTAQRRALKGVQDDLHVLLETRIGLLESAVLQSANNLKQSDQDEIVRLREENELRKQTLQDQIDAMTKKAYQLRVDRISELEEALTIAKSLDITEPTTLRLLSHSGEPVEAIAFSADLSSSASDPLFFRGSRILEAEIAALRARASDAYTIAEIRDLQMKLSLLQRNRRIETLLAREDYLALADNATKRSEINQLRELLGTEYDSVQLARTDQVAIARSVPAQPKSGYVLGVAGLLGLMVGLLGALIAASVQNRRQHPPAPDTAQ